MLNIQTPGELIEEAKQGCMTPLTSGNAKSLKRGLSQQIAANLRSAILSGEIEPGAKLNQSKVAEQLEVSTTPVREAFRILEAQGLVEIDTYAGASVTIPTLQDLTSLYQIRFALCPLVTQCVVQHITKNQLTRAREINEQLVTANDKVEVNQLFHATLDEVIPEQRLRQIWGHLSVVSAIYVNLSSPYRLAAHEGAHDEHVRMVDAYEKGNAALAQRMLIEHLQSTYEGCRLAMSNRCDDGFEANARPAVDGEVAASMVSDETIRDRHGMGRVPDDRLQSVISESGQPFCPPSDSRVLVSAKKTCGKCSAAMS